MICILRADHCDLVQMICDFTVPSYYIALIFTSCIHLCINHGTT